jgi:hypothetical protein
VVSMSSSAVWMASGSGRFLAVRSQLPHEDQDKPEHNEE